ncbi:MFS transporter [Pseudomonas aeruginosa]|uniref:MFS transporter n=12 Tax=Pseudomonas aeruginosa TaxID=287 RepID=UPI000651E168|nr:MFS transporter [Pseudomonas aeruginosa]
MNAVAPLIPCIVSGGSGTRLWPVSRESMPKPFMRLADDQSLLQKTFLRIAGLPDVARLLTVTNRDLLFRTLDDYRAVNRSGLAQDLLLEPMGRNTAPAIAAAALHVQEHFGDQAQLLILPADHLIRDEQAFAAAVAEARGLAAQGYLVTFGITPERAETGFGYIEQGAPLGNGFRVARFVEKPDQATAQSYLDSGKYLWNAGMFCFQAATVLQELERHAPEVLIAARAGLAVGAALMMPATLSIVRHVFQDERERALAIGIWASVASAGAALGPVVGGVLLEFFWWGSVFLINVPVVVVALLLALPAIPACGGQSRRPWDALGSLQVMFGLVGVVYAIKELSTRAPDFGLAVLAALGGMLCLYLFVRRQRRAREPMIDFALFRNRRFARGVAVALVATMALVGMELVVSQHLQLVQGLTPLKAGLFVLPIPLASLVVGPLAGWLVPRWGENRVMCASLLLGSAGLLGLALSYQSATGAQLASLVLLGVGFGGAMTAASTAVMLNVDEQSSGMAAAIEDVSYELGGVIGVTLLGSLMSFVYGMSLRLPSAELPARVRDSLDDALLVAEGLAPEVASRLVELARQAFDQAFVAVLLAAAALLFLSAMAVLRQPRPATEPAPPAPHTR